MTSPFKDKHGHTLTWSEARPKLVIRLKNYGLDLKIWLIWILGYFPSHIVRRLIFKLSGVKIGIGSTIHIGARFYEPHGVTIGQGTIIGDHATLDGRSALKIGDHVDIASEVMIFNSQHDIYDEWFSPLEKPVTIGDYVFIGPRSIILPGVTIGKGAVIGAGAVVTKDIPDHAVVGGIPAQIISKRNLSDYHYRLGRPRLFQ